MALEIPAEIEGYPVTEIGAAAFSGCTSLTEIELPSTLTTLGNFAFSGCLPITTVGAGAFDGPPEHVSHFRDFRRK